MAKSTMYCIAIVAIARYRLLTRSAAKPKTTPITALASPPTSIAISKGAPERTRCTHGVSADRHHRAIAEMDLTGAAHQQIEPERGRRPDQPRQQIGDEIKPVDDERRRQRQRDDDADQQPIEWQRP